MNVLEEIKNFALTDEDRMFGTALVVGNEAIKFHLLYPQGVAPLY